jgi:hypothetical protein
MLLSADKLIKNVRDVQACNDIEPWPRSFVRARKGARHLWKRYQMFLHGRSVCHLLQCKTTSATLKARKRAERIKP